MDMRSWRKVVLQWITECNFMDHNYFNIEQTDIDAFFRNFCSKHATAKETESFQSFLKTYYPDFNPNTDEQNDLSSADYVYYYSLLLHFSCVKYPDEFFHGICQKLSEQCQQNIAEFFKQILHCSHINKKSLRNAIDEVAQLCISSPASVQNIKNESVSSNSSCSTGPINFEVSSPSSRSQSNFNGESPMRTPHRKKLPDQRISPSTPKSYLLEERTRELYNYKAQLETERYEKGLLELEIKQNEEKIANLNQVQKKLHQQIQSLKDELLNQSAEAKIGNEQEDEELKMRLLRQINEREDNIFCLNGRIVNLGEEKTLLQNKLRHAEKKVADYRETISELELRLNEMITEMEKKDTTIKCLSDDKAELEHFIAESRTASNHSRQEFNSSNDLLDSSFIRCTNSSGSHSSPETLAVSVVDVQLREKEHENAKLRDELAEILAYNKKFYLHMQEKANLFKKQYNFEIINADVIPNDTGDDLETEFTSFLDCVNFLDQSYKDAKEYIVVLEDDVSSMKTNNNNLQAQIGVSAKEIEKLKENLENMEKKNKMFKEKVEKLDATVNDYKKKLEMSNGTNEEFKSYIDALNEKLRLQTLKLESLDKIESKLFDENNNLKNNIVKLREEMQKCQSLNQKLQETIDTQNSKLEFQIKEEKEVQKKIEQLQTKNNELSKMACDTKNHLESMTANIKTKERELSEMGKEIDRLTKANADLEDCILKATQDFENKKSENETTIQVLQKLHAETLELLKKKCQDFESIEMGLCEIYKKIDSNSSSLQNPNNSNANSNDDCKGLLQLNKIKIAIEVLLDDQSKMAARMLEMEQNCKHFFEKLQDFGSKLSIQAINNSNMLSHSKDKIEKMSERLSKSQRKIEQLKVVINKMREKYEEEKQQQLEELKAVQSMVKELNSEQYKLKEKHEEERRHWFSKQDQLEAELNGEKEMHASNRADWAKQIEDLVETKNLLNDREHQLIEQIDSRTKDLLSKEEQLKILNTNYDQLTKQNEELQTCRQLLEKELQQVKQEYNKYSKRELKNSESRLQDLQLSYSNEKTNFEIKISKLEENLKALTSQNEQHLLNEMANEKRILEADANLKELTEQLEKTRALVSERNKKLQDTQSMLTETCQKLENKTKTWESVQEKCEKYSKELEILRKKTLDIESLQTQTENQAHEINELKNINNANSIRIKELQAEIQSKENKINNLEFKYNDLVKINDERADEIRCLLNELQTLKNEYDNTKAESEQVSIDFNELVNEKTQIIDQLREQLKETEASLQNVNTECAKLQSEIVEKEAEIRINYDEIKQAQDHSKIELNNAFESIKLMEKAITTITILLENLEKNETKDIEEFHANFNENCKMPPCLIRLREVTKKVLATINQQQITLKEIQNLQAQLKGLNEKHAITLTDLENLKSVLKLEKQSVENLEQEKGLLERTISNEHERYTKDIESLQRVNENLSQENATLLIKLSNIEGDLHATEINYGMVKAINDRLNRSQQTIEMEYSKKIDELTTQRECLQKTIDQKEKAFENLEKLVEDLKKEASDKEAELEQKLQYSQEELKQLIAEKEKQLEERKTEKEAFESLAKKCKDLECKNTELSTQTDELQKECIVLRSELAVFKENCIRANDELASLESQLEDAKANNNTYNAKLSMLNIKNQQLELSVSQIEAKLNTANSELEVLTKEKENLLEEKQKLTETVQLTKRECQDLGKAIHNLNQKMALKELEKDDLSRQLDLLQTQVEVNSRYQTTSESKLKNIVETTQALERNLLSSENALKTARASLEQFKLNTEKLETENKKLRDNSETLNKRVEKMALKLGETQGRADKLERDNEKLIKTNETQIGNIETLQREREIQQMECKTLRERINRLERSNEQYSTKVQSAEKMNAMLVAANQKLEAAEVDLKSKISKLEKCQQTIEERLRKTTQDYEHYERENVNLIHQIGALNNEILILKKAANADRQSNNELNKELVSLKERAIGLEMQNKKFSNDQSEERQRNQDLTDRLSKNILALEISKSQYDQLNTELIKLQDELKKVHQEKINLVQTQYSTANQLEESKKLNENILNEKHQLEEKMLSFKNEVTAKDAEISAMRKEINDLCQNAKDSSASLSDKAAKLVGEVESLRNRLIATEKMLEKEQENNSKLRSDNQILQAKYKEAKNRVEAEIANAEERMKQNRLEMEGKLEKMKNKMKTLYIEEVSKMKSKQERETVTLRSEISMLKAQNEKFEENIRKLSAELMTLNDRMLYYQKQNTHLSAKLKHTQNENIDFKRPTVNNIHTSTATLPRLNSASSIPSNMGKGLAMEDEEGEMFNNTYLTDLKNGRMSLVGPEELQHRNSLLPPHLKSSYAVQYDHGLCEDEVKEGPANSLDDSMCALISNNNSNCVRKKIIGVTHYRKPGPPTPSKNGGRLSFGGNSEPSREILKESYDENTNNAPSSTKTPARFSFLGSRFSMGNPNTTRDEYEDGQENEQQQQQQIDINYYQQNSSITCKGEVYDNENDLRRVLQNKNLGNLFDEVEQYKSKTKICTSTPRKSRDRFSLYQRRLIKEKFRNRTPTMGSAITTAATDPSISPKEITSPEISAIETPVLSRRGSTTFTKAKIRCSIKGSTGSSTGFLIASLRKRIRKRPRREQGARPSLCVNKNLYSNNSCTPQRGAMRDLNRILGRKQRMIRFDRQRVISNTSSSTIDGDSDIDVECTQENEVDTAQITAIVADATFALNDNNAYQTVTISKPLHCDTSLDDCNSNQSSLVNQTYSNVNGETEILSTELNTFSENIERLHTELCFETDTSSVRFEKLLKETASQAPFQIRNLRLSSIGTTQSDSGMTTSTSRSSASDQNLNEKQFSSSTAVTFAANSMKSTKSNTNSGISDVVFTTVKASPHLSVPSPRTMLLNSRTIYGASVIFNRRIPNVDGLHIRKSSIYFKNPKCSTLRSSYDGLSAIDSNCTNAAGFTQEGDLILVTNQTITLYDLICMWQQMNVLTRGVVSAVLIGSMGAIVSLSYMLFFNR